MNVKPYEYLLAIEMYRNLSGAAKAIGISQPALSKFLTKTEQEMGVRLFTRNGRVLTPTSAGEAYLKTCREIVRVKRQTYSSIAMLSAPPADTIHVGVTPYRGSQMFSAIFAQFYARYPNVRIQLHEGYMSQLQAEVTNGTCDLALGSLEATQEQFFGFATTAYDELLLTVPLSHPYAAKGSDSGNYFPIGDIHEVVDAPFIMWGKSTTNRRVIERFLEINHVLPTIIYESDNALLINEMLKQGFGIGFLPTAFCHPHENRVYFSSWPPVQTFIGVYFRKTLELTEPMRYFIYLVARRSAVSKSVTSGQDVYYNKITREIMKEFSGKEIE